MKASLIVYNLSKLNHYQKVILNRTLFGYTNNSNNNQYHYKIKGVLDEIPHFRFPKGAMIVKKTYQNKIVNILKKNKAKYNLFEIDVKQKMLQKN